MNYRHIRIHGDNIVECERTLAIISKALTGSLKLVDCPLYLPTYELFTGEVIFKIELLSGYDRWGVNIGKQIINNGGVLREAADSYLSEVEEGHEKILLAIEYCSALPAGNNAWQRNGRALSSVLAGIPYLYIAELGGVELNENREAKAPRYPNPLVPFSYLCANSDYRNLCMPVYLPHPSISEELNSKFSDIFGNDAAMGVVKDIILHNDVSKNTNVLKEKALKLIEILSQDKVIHNTLLGSEWRKFLQSKHRGKWIIENTNLVWNKKTSSKVNSHERVKYLIKKAVEMSQFTIGASDIPICLIEQNKIPLFENILHKIYPNININLPNNKPLAVIWITGYKPHGDDSRPDRGLCPLAKMVLGNSCSIISVVHGPAKPQTWKILDDDIKKLAESNGLWQAIYKVCDGVLVDSITMPIPTYINIKQKTLKPRKELRIPYYPDLNPEYSEQDIDTAIHQILTRGELVECMCNPPGGDWSGINYYNKGAVYRWTSLPRVSKIGGKRPDHVFQESNILGDLFLSIESKGKGSDLENGIGISLALYLKQLFSTNPTSIKRFNGEWRLYNQNIDFGNYEILSVGAFIYKNDAELHQHLERGNLDCVMAFEFQNTTTLHLLATSRGAIIEDFIKKASKGIYGVEVKVHRF